MSRLLRIYMMEAPAGISTFMKGLAAKYPHFDELVKGWVKRAQDSGQDAAEADIEDEAYANWGATLTDDDVKTIKGIVKSLAGSAHERMNSPVDVPSKKKRGFSPKSYTKGSKPASDKAYQAFDRHFGLDADDDSEGDDDDLGPDMDYEDPSPGDGSDYIDMNPLGDDEEDNPYRHPAARAKDTKKSEPEKSSPFTSKSAPPSKALQGGKTAGSLKADPKTLDALQRALEAVRTRDDDLQDWVDDAIREIGRALRSGGELTLPKFEATPRDLEDDDADNEDY